MRRSVLSIAVLFVLGIPLAAPAGVHLISVTSPVSSGAKATVTASVSPAQLCSIAVQNATGVYPTPNLKPTRPKSGRVSWSWSIAKKMPAGTWTVKVSCGTAGSLTTSMQVVAYSTVHR
jgi:hypothetical protein